MLHATDVEYVSGKISLTVGGEPHGGGQVNHTLDCGFSCEAIPLDIVLVIDRSGSMGSQSLLEAREDAELFLNLMDPLVQRIGVVSFESSATLESELMSPASHALQRIRDLKDGGGTYLNTGLELGTSHLAANKLPGSAQVIIVLSDGKTSAKTATRAAAQSAKEQGILILTWSEGPSADTAFLKEIASGPENFVDRPSRDDVVAAHRKISPSGCEDPAGGSLICASGEATDIGLSTGGYPWEVSTDGVNFVPAQVVASPPAPPWGTLPGAAWISLEPTIGQSQPGVIDYTYRTTFMAPPNSGRALLEFDAYSDDRIKTILVNGGDYNLGTGGNGLAGVPHHYERPGSATNWLNPGGPNTIVIVVEDPFGGHTGLDLAGKVSFCPQSEPPEPPPTAMPFEIQISAFIPYDNADDPVRSSLTGEGDIPRSHDRTARASDPYATDGFRMRSRIVVNPIRILDTGNGGILEDEERFFGMSREYDKASSLDGEGFLTDAARNDTTLDDGYLKVHEGLAVPRPAWKVDTAWLGERILEVTLRGSASAPVLGGFVPAIDWNVSVIIDATDPDDVQYTLSGEHDGFPSYDVFINCEDVYFAPVAEGKSIWDLRPGMDHDIVRFTCSQGDCGANYCE